MIMIMTLEVITLITIQIMPMKNITLKLSALSDLET